MPLADGLGIEASIATTAHGGTRGRAGRRRRLLSWHAARLADGELILIAGALLAGGLLASLVAGRLRVPGLLLFLFLGMAIGSDGLGWIDFSDVELARRIGIIALALILFEGGLTAGLPEIRPVLGSALSLAILGTILTALVTGLAAAALFDVSTLDGLLLGGVLAATDGAAIFALLRTSTLKRRLARTLEGESGMNDPVAVLLVLGFIDWIEKPDYGVLDMLVLFVRQLGIGLAIGLAIGFAAAWGLRRVRLATGGLYPVATLAVAGLAYGGADELDGSGFLAVYLAGLVLGTIGVPAQQTVTAFHGGVAWVAQVTMFVALGLLVFPSRLDDVAVRGTVLALVLVFIARPVAVAVSTARARFTWPERAVLAGAGLRGAVPVVLATFPVIADVPQASRLFDVVFFAVLLSTLIQGATFEPVASLLGATTSEPALPRPLTEAGTIRGLGAEVLEYEIGSEDAVAGARVRDLGLPREAVVNVIVRGDEAIPPRGSTRLQPGDRLHVLLRSEVSRDVPRLVERWRGGPVGPPPRPRARPHGRPPVFSVCSLAQSDVDGDPARPAAVAGEPVAAQLRIRRDVPGALVALVDGRYAVIGPLVAVGGRRALTSWAARRLGRLEATDPERAWLQNVVGALAADVPE
jgi:cell volume regulation protein A